MNIFAERSELLAELEALRAESDGLRRFNNVNLDAAKARLIENDKLRAELAARHAEIAGYKSAITINAENIRDRVAERDAARLERDEANARVAELVAAAKKAFAGLKNHPECYATKASEFAKQTLLDAIAKAEAAKETP